MSTLILILSCAVLVTFAGLMALMWFDQLADKEIEKQEKENNEKHR
jgi:flagellar basal body-associated protein FliL